MHFPPSPVEPFRFGDRAFFVKRDDLSHPYLSGNKYRKLHALIQTPAEEIDRIVSHGGIQSNAMLAIAALCREKGWRFEYIAKTVPSRLRAHPSGNYRRALERGMRLEEADPAEYRQAVERGRRRAEKGRSLFVPQGGAAPAAREGVAVLAKEIRAWAGENGFTSVNVVTPSGTGTTAAFLAEALPEHTVVTAPAVGDEALLVRQIENLLPLPPNLKILTTRKRFRFASLYPELLQMYLQLQRAGIEFDLLYAPVMWTALLENIRELEGEILYVHSGGVTGNETMLERYRYKTGE